MKRLWFFDFSQAAAARALAELTAEGVTPRRIRRDLAALRAWVPDEEALLTHLEMLEAGGPLVVRTHDGDLAEASGQLRLDFESRSTAAPVLPEPDPAVTWFSRGVLAEETDDLETAHDAYLHAMALGVTDAEVAFNLGNVLYAMDRTLEAAARYREAITVDPEYVEAWNNLGNALAAIGEADEAESAFLAALALEPAYADAHYNLAETLAAAGDRTRAESHWRTYLTLDPESVWAEEVRRRLES